MKKVFIIGLLTLPVSSYAGPFDGVLGQAISGVIQGVQNQNQREQQQRQRQQAEQERTQRQQAQGASNNSQPDEQQQIATRVMTGANNVATKLMNSPRFVNAMNHGVDVSPTVEKACQNEMRDATYSMCTQAAQELIMEKRLSGVIN